MKYNDYINDSDVKCFIKHLRYLIANFNKSHWIASEQHQFNCNNFHDAYKNYRWTSNFTAPHNAHSWFGNNTRVPTTDWNSTVNVLNRLSNALTQAITSNNENITLEWCRCILEWGMGTRGRATLQNLMHLENNKKLCSFLNTLSKALNDPNLDINANLDRLVTLPGQSAPWMSSGLAKIISLSSQNIIIMDSRVGAALCEIINCYLNACNQPIPDLLRLAWAPASYGRNFTGPVNRRKPVAITVGTDHPQFQRNTSWLKQQIKASWLLKATIDDNLFATKVSLTPHQLEAALFMIGYNLDNNNQATYEKRAASLRIANQTAKPNNPSTPPRNIIQWQNDSPGPLSIRHTVLDMYNYVPTMATTRLAIERAANNEPPKQGDTNLLTELGLVGDQNNNDLQKIHTDEAHRKTYLTDYFANKAISEFPKHLVATFLYGEFNRRYHGKYNDSSLRQWLIADGYANTRNPEGRGADNLITAAKTFGTYFGLLTNDNEYQPTQFFRDFFQV